MGKAKILKRSGYGFLALLYIFGFLSILFMPMPKASALTPGNFALLPGEPDIVNKAYSDGGDLVGLDENYFKRQGLSQISILVKDFPTIGDFALPYNPERSEYFGKNVQDVRDDDISGVGELFFTFTYFCTLPEGKIAAQSSNGTVDEYIIEYAVGLFPLRDGIGLATDFAARDNYRVATGPIKIDRKYKTSDGRNSEEVFKIWNDGSPQEIGPQDITGRFNRLQGVGVPTSCIPASIRGEAPISNYNRLTPAQQAPFEAALADAPTADGTLGQAQPDCSVKLTSPVSWILCPVIDIMAGFSDFVFSGIVKPLLADVPISTDPEDSGYKAWQQFRILGNVVLVGAMIAVVYAQIKGS